MKLSILIPSTFDREAMTEILKAYIQKQIDEIIKPDLVEVFTKYDNKELSIGAKRQMMLSEAKGEYVVMIDSDDWVPTDYVFEVLKGLETNPDCIGHLIECSGTHGKTESVSKRFWQWCEKRHGFDYIRTPYPKVPIKRSICLQVGYKDLRYSEDHDFSIRLKDSGLLQTEVYIDKILYFYRYKFQEHNFKYGIK